MLKVKSFESELLQTIHQTKYVIEKLIFLQKEKYYEEYNIFIIIMHDVRYF